ncbi:MAG: hypothetical protein II005_03570 [Turicibacter sp.]|nr:hypothetical protein [Turicibacter sp.]
MFLWVTLSVISSIPIYNWKVFFPDTPSSIGTLDDTNLVGKDSILIEREYARGNIIFPNLSTHDSELTKMFFSPTSTDEKMNEMQFSEKNKLVKGLFPFNSEESTQIYQKVFSLIPNKLLNMMLNDKLEIILSELEPIIVDGGMLTGYYERSNNRIIIYRSEHCTTTLVHELGHWLERYIKRNLDFYLFNRISDDMLEEMNHLGLNEFSLNYVKSNDFEVFATLFEFFIHDYEKLKTNAPISFEYIAYYLEKLLME